MTDAAHDTFTVLEELAQLEYDGLYALDASVKGVQDERLRSMLQTVRGEHASDLAELESLLRSRGSTLEPQTESLRGLRAEAHVAGAALAGDDAVLERVMEHESDVIDAYTRADADPALPGDLRERLRKMRDADVGRREAMRRWLAANV